MKNKFIAICCLMFTFVTALFLASCGVSSDPTNPDDPIADSSTGGTLVQETGVDEGDIVKNYGDYVYKLQADGVTVYKIKDGRIELFAVGKFSSSRNIPLEMYVTDESIAVIYGKTSSVDDDFYGTPGTNKKNYNRVCVDVLVNPPKTASEPYDLFKNVKYSFSMMGALVASRTYVDSKQAYFAFNYGGSFTYSDNTHKTDKTGDDDISNITGAKGTKIYYVENGQTKTYENAETIPGLNKFVKNYAPTVFTSINLDDPSSGILSAVFGAELQDIYMSKTSVIPIFTTIDYSYSSQGCYGYSKVQRTTYCFKLSPDLAIVDGVTLLNYNIYDRRAIKDYGDVIYIAATKTDRSGTTVIALDGEKFSLINRLDKIAPDEDVKSVTFGEENGKRYCYITTFLQIDPLFKIDVTDPYRMETSGFMEMPGFSTFMLSVGDRLITVGYADNGAQGVVSTMKVAMYDAKGDGLTPIDERTIENVYYCEAIDDPRVIAVSGTMFAFSVTRSQGYRYPKSQELYIFDLKENEIACIGSISNFALNENTEDGIKYKIGYIEVNGEIKPTTAYGSYALQITRARFKDGYIYTFSDGAIASYRIIIDDNTETGKLIADKYTERVFTSLYNTPVYNNPL